MTLIDVGEVELDYERSGDGPAAADDHGHAAAPTRTGASRCSSSCAATSS